MTFCLQLRQISTCMIQIFIHSLVISAYPWGSQTLGGNPSGHWESMQTPQREAFIFFLQHYLSLTHSAATPHHLPTAALHISHFTFVVAVSSERVFIPPFYLTFWRQHADCSADASKQSVAFFGKWAASSQTTAMWLVRNICGWFLVSCAHQQFKKNSYYENVSMIGAFLSFIVVP